MRELKVFFKRNCPRCPVAKQLAQVLESKGGRVNYFDVDTVDGLAEAALHTVQATPSLIVCDESDMEIASWRGDVPLIEEIDFFLLPEFHDHQATSTADAAG